MATNLPRTPPSNADSPDALAKALAYLDAAGQRWTGTAAGAPPIAGIAANLGATFGAHIALPLAQRLAEQPQMPHWRAMATLAYLDEHRAPAIVPHIARFAFATERESEQELAIRILGSIGGPAVAAAVRAERDRMAATGRTIPPALAALVGTPTRGPTV